MVSIGNYAAQIGSEVNKARFSYLSGKLDEAINHHNKALKPFAGYCLAIGVISEADVLPVERELAIPTIDQTRFSLSAFSRFLAQNLKEGAERGKRVVIVTGPSATGKNVLANLLVNELPPATLTDIDSFNFVIRERLVAGKSFSAQLAEDDVLALDPFVEHVNSRLAKGENVVLPVVSALVPRLPLQQWPNQVVNLLPQRPGKHAKVWRWLMYQFSGICADLGKYSNSFLLDINNKERSSGKIKQADYTFDQKSGLCLDRAGDPLFRVNETIQLNEIDPFFGALNRQVSAGFLRNYIDGRKMDGIYKFWEKLA